MERFSELGKCGKEGGKKATTAMNYIGIDIHKKQCVLSALDEAGERMREARIGTNDRAGFAEYLRAVGGPCRAVIEACWGWGKVHDLLEATGLVEEVVLAHPYKVRIIAEAQIKTDKVDARIRWRFCCGLGQCRARMCRGWRCGGARRCCGSGCSGCVNARRSATARTRCWIGRTRKRGLLNKY